MLYLGDGVRQVTVGEDRALYLFPDFSSPDQFYYLPNVPHIAAMPDGTPAIRLLVYREDFDTLAAGEEEAVAFLSLDVDVGWDPELIDEAASQLRTEDDLEAKPRLTPIFFRQGSVRLMLLDAVTPDEEQSGGSEEQPTAFVTRIEGSSSPSLFGDNRAIFQAVLTKKGAAALSASLDGVTPIGVVYSLTFAGLQPAFHVKARVDWQKVYDHFSEQEHLDLLFYERDVQKSIDTLVEERAIEIDVTIEGVGADAMDAERQAAMDAVRQLIFDNFFEATIERADAAGAGTADRVVDTLTSLFKNSFTLGIGYTYRRKEVTIEQLRTLELDWSVRRASERTIYPQAHMYNLLTGSGVTEEQLVTVIDGADALWKSLPFEVIAAAAWDADSIVGITVDVEYDDADSGETRSWSTFLDKEKPAAVHRDWMDRTSGNRCRYKYEVVFLDEGVPGPAPKVSSGDAWIEHQGSEVVIHPGELYDSVALEVSTVPGFPFERWPAVQAVVRYRTEDGSFEHFADAVLQAGATTLTTRFRTDRGVEGSREVRLLYVGDGGERVETGWMPMEQTTWIVEDPHDEEFVVRAIVSGDRNEIANLIVDLEYSDPENEVHQRGTLEFHTENIHRSQTWTVHAVDPTRRRYRYRMTLVTRDGDFMQTGWIGTDAPTIPVGEVYVRRLTVEVATGELADGVEAVEAHLVYDDPDNQVHEEETFRLAANGRSEWQVRLRDASRRSYAATFTWIAEDGFDTTVGPTTRSETYLVIPGAPPDSD